MNAMRFPSGRKRGVFSVRSPPISCRAGAELSDGTSQMSEFLRPDSSAVVVLVYSTRLPSGEICGSLTRTVVIKSSTVMGRLLCADIATGDRVIKRSDTRANGRGIKVPPWSWDYIWRHGHTGVNELAVIISRRGGDCRQLILTADSFRASLKHMIAAERQPLAFAAEADIDPHEHAGAELQAYSSTGGGMQMPQSEVGGIRKDTSRICKCHNIKKTGQRPAIFDIEYKSVTIAETVWIESADCAAASNCGQHEKRHVLYGS